MKVIFLAIPCCQTSIESLKELINNSLYNHRNNSQNSYLNIQYCKPHCIDFHSYTGNHQYMNQYIPYSHQNMTLNNHLYSHTYNPFLFVIHGLG